MQNDPESRVRYVLDTDTVTHLQMGRTPAVGKFIGTPSGQAGTTVVSMSEQLRGRLAEISRARDGMALLRAYEHLQSTQQFYCRMLVLPFDAPAHDVYGRLVAQRLRIGTQDLRIAAIVLANDGILVTSNRRDFERVPGLRIEDWTVA